MKNIILQGDCRVKLLELEDESVDCIVTSPPYYGLRDYGVDGQVGLEFSPKAYIEVMVEIFRECRRVLKNDGTLWLNIGDSYWSNKNRNGYEFEDNVGKNKNYMLRPGGENDLNLKPKDLMGMPWRIAFALQDDGWFLRSDIIWSKSNCMPEAVKDRPTKSHEYIFLFSKSRYYYYDHESIREEALSSDVSSPRGSKGVLGNKHKGNRKTFRGGTYVNNQIHNHEEMKSDSTGNEASKDNKRNKRSVWHVSTSHEKAAHFATFPEKLIEPCILAGCKENGIVLDPFMGSGTVAKKAIELRRDYIGIELNPEYIELIKTKISHVQLRLVL
jgi:DNA modification methylase